MADGHLIAVARWLAEQPLQQVTLGACGVVVAQDAVDREQQLVSVHAAIDQLDALGFVRFHHHPVMSAVAVLHRLGLRRLADREPFDAVAADVERQRPLTVVRAPDLDAEKPWTAWYRPAHGLPVWTDGAGVVLAKAGQGATADAAVADLQCKTRMHLK